MCQVKNTKDSNLEFAYTLFVTPFGKGYGCFALRRDGDKVRVGASFCSPFDRSKFSKPKARGMAAIRANSEAAIFNKMAVEVIAAPDQDGRIENSKIIQAAIDEGLMMPSWADKAWCRGAMLWKLTKDSLTCSDLIEELDLGYEFYCEIKSHLEAFKTDVCW